MPPADPGPLPGDGPPWSYLTPGPYLEEVQAESPGRRHLGFPIGGPSDPDAFEILRRFTVAVIEIHATSLRIPPASGSLLVLGRAPVVAGRVGNAWVSCQHAVEISPGTGRMVTVGYLAKRGPARHIRLADLPGGSGPFRVVPLPESPIAFPSRPLHLSPRSDRTGTRCLPSAGFRHDVERPSQPCDRGHIQVTRHGELIVLGPDGPTIGGYPRLGALIRADWGRFARAGWADPIEFCPTTWNDAAHLGHEHQLRLTDLARQWAVTLGN